jgi:hypothetical protein
MVVICLVKLHGTFSEKRPVKKLRPNCAPLAQSGRGASATPRDRGDQPLIDQNNQLD